MTAHSRTSTGDERQTAPQRRQKRAQVARACDGCRLRRTKCDNKTPCSNCVAKERICSNSGAPKASTLTQASEEIESLKRRVKQLEAELKQRSSENINLPTPTGSSSSPAQFFTRSDNEYRNPKNCWGGIHLRPARSSNETWLGASSLHFFIQRLSIFLAFNFQQAHSTQQLLPISASDHHLLDRPAARSNEDPTRRLTSSAELPTTGVYLKPTQEEYFIDLFWHTYHTSMFPILDETQFKDHYQSLWVTGGKERNPSALVDIVIAMCMQYGISTLPSNAQGTLVEGKDALVAGRWHYWRGQTLLAYELESPSLSTLQCHLLCAIYLCGGSFHNMMDTAVGLSVRTAYMLGIHQDPPHDMPEREREMRRRLWWAVYLMDSKAGMKLGRPFMLRDSHAMPSLPNDSLDAARTSGSIFAPIGDEATWLSFNLHQVKLYMKVRAAYTCFYDQDLHLSNGQIVWDDSHALETSAEALTHHIQGLQEWTDNVPGALKLNRQNNGKPLSTDGTGLSIEQFAPLWLQRQRVLLEITYHHLSTNIYRPLISFGSKPHPGTLAEEVAMQCASHAIMLSKITHQVLTETLILDGWHEAFHYQWNAAMTLIGFVVVYQHSSLTTEARAAVDLAISVFDNFGAKFSVAVNAAKIVRELCLKVDILVHHSQLQVGSLSELDMGSMDNSVDISDDFMSNSSFFTSLGGSSGLSKTGSVDVSEFNFFDMAVDIDFWNSVDTLWPEFDNLAGQQISA